GCPAGALKACLGAGWVIEATTPEMRRRWPLDRNNVGVSSGNARWDGAHASVVKAHAVPPPVAPNRPDHDTYPGQPTASPAGVAAGRRSGPFRSPLALRHSTEPGN